jgi:hypothetical protein
MHRIAVVVVPPVSAFDLSVAEMLFGNTIIDGTHAYQLTVCTADPGWIPTTGSVRINVDRGTPCRGRSGHSHRH